MLQGFWGFKAVGHDEGLHMRFELSIDPTIRGVPKYG